MVPAKDTAEEQLLRMIEGPGGPTPSRKALRRLPLERFLEQARAAVERVWHWILPPQRHWEEADPLLWRLRVAQRAFWVTFGGLAVYLAVELLFVRRRVPAMVRVSSPQAGESFTVPVGEPEVRLKSPSEFRETLILRNPFGLPAPIARQTEQEASKSKLAELTKTLSVVGINRGRVPEALIEDTVAQRTYFVKVGDQVNGLTVKAIDQQGVLLGYEHEETRLQ